MPGMMRGALLWASRNNGLRERASRYKFVRRSVSRFMPGEQIADALAAAGSLENQGLGTVLTHLGENVSTEAEAESVTRHYLEALAQVRAAGLRSELSVKLTHLGLDLGHDLCRSKVEKILQAAGQDSFVWIDMESSPYVDATLDLYRSLRRTYSNVGVCLQAYLYRTAGDLASLLPMGPGIRLVKGAYLEPAKVAYPRKEDVDENYFALASRLLSKEARAAGLRAAIATHDLQMIHRVESLARSENLTGDDFQFQMLYGIQRAEQLRLARDGWRSGVLISYGTLWFPWYMRRLAERPANVGFVIRNMLGG
ncbi:MAG TPA: proline dehydrogenase family protein [Terriglobia bacterium]|nr:proline dehydrogenase family protein [Terriglobia bacterium]